MGPNNKGTSKNRHERVESKAHRSDKFARSKLGQLRWPKAERQEAANQTPKHIR